jgi:hypothetical protein
VKDQLILRRLSLQYKIESNVEQYSFLDKHSTLQSRCVGTQDTCTCKELAHWFHLLSVATLGCMKTVGLNMNELNSLIRER